MKQNFLLLLFISHHFTILCLLILIFLTLVILTPYSYAILMNLNRVNQSQSLLLKKDAVDTLSWILHFLFQNLVYILNQEISLPPPKPLTIPAFESVDTLSEKYPLSDIDSTTFSFIYPRFLPSNSASKHTTSSLVSFLETSSESTICRTPRHTYNLRYSRNPTLSLASTNSSLVRNLALFPHAKNFSPLVLTLLFSTLLFFFL